MGFFFGCTLPAVSKCSFDSLSLQESLEEFLIGLFGLPTQFLFPLPPQSLRESESNFQQKNIEEVFNIGLSDVDPDVPESVSSAVAPPHQTQTLA